MLLPSKDYNRSLDTQQQVQQANPTLTDELRKIFEDLHFL